MIRISLRTAVILFALIFIGGALYDFCEWLFAGKSPALADQQKIIDRIKPEIASQMSLTRTVKVDGRMARMKWNPAAKDFSKTGECSATATYVYDGPGFCRIECSHEVGLASGVEGDNTERAFVSVWNGTSAATLITAANAREVHVETHRPADMEFPDEATGWRCSFLGRFPEQRDGEFFTDILDRSEKDAALSASQDASHTLLSFTLIRPDEVEIYSADTTEDFALSLWEDHERTPAATPGRLRSKMEVTNWWKINDLHYPHEALVTRYAPDGSESEKDYIVVNSFTISSQDPAPGLYHLDIPAGDLTLIDQGRPSKLHGTQSENNTAVQSAWNNASAPASQTASP